MQISVIRIGNSKGIRLPKIILEKYGIAENDTFEMDLEKDKIILRPKKKSAREGWAAQFKKAQEEGTKPDNDLFEGMNNKFDEEEWTW